MDVKIISLILPPASYVVLIFLAIERVFGAEFRHLSTLIYQNSHRKPQTAFIFLQEIIDSKVPLRFRVLLI